MQRLLGYAVRPRLLRPRTHITPLVKAIGDLFVAQWAIANDATESRVARMAIYEVQNESALAIRGGTGWTVIPAQSEVDFDASGPTSGSWTLNVQVSATITLEGAFTLEDVTNENTFVVAAHEFFITVSSGGGGLMLSAIGDPFIQ